MGMAIGWTGERLYYQSPFHISAPCLLESDMDGHSALCILSNLINSACGHLLAIVKVRGISHSSVLAAVVFWPALTWLGSWRISNRSILSFVCTSSNPPLHLPERPQPPRPAPALYIPPRSALSFSCLIAAAGAALLDIAALAVAAGETLPVPR
jgi:hypothetical protein